MVFRGSTSETLQVFWRAFCEGGPIKGQPTLTAKLHRHDVIPESIQNRVAAAQDNETANSILLEFLTHQSTSESLNALLVVMAEAQDYPAMSKLGKDMKAALRRTTPVAGPGRRCAGTM